MTVCFLASGVVYTVGFNGRGQLGHGTTVTAHEPLPVQELMGKHIVDVSCSYFHTMMITVEGELFACGRNDSGQLGTGDGIDRYAPFPVSYFANLPVLAVACGNHHTVVSLRTICHQHM